MACSPQRYVRASKLYTLNERAVARRFGVLTPTAFTRTQDATCTMNFERMGALDPPYRPAQPLDMAGQQIVVVTLEQIDR